MVSFDESLVKSLQPAYNIKFVNTSYLGLVAGDMVVVSYGGSTRVGFIMSSSRTSTNGLFSVTSTKNTLLNFVDGTSINGLMFRKIVDRLYNKDSEPIVYEFDYSSGGSLAGVAVKDRFKTLNISEISGKSVIRIELTRNE